MPRRLRSAYLDDGKGVAGVMTYLAATTVNGYSLRMLPWDLARAGGITAYLLVVAAVTLGIVESTPRLGRVPSVRHVSHHYHRWVMLFALCFVVVHVTSLVLDPYAGVSLAAVFIPGLSQYRPVQVSLGTLALLAGLLAGVTAWFPARYPKIWLPIHRFGAVIFALVWIHGVTSGTDTTRLIAFYAVTGALPLLAAVARYIITRPQRRRRPHAPTSEAVPPDDADAPGEAPGHHPAAEALAASGRADRGDAVASRVRS